MYEARMSEIGKNGTRGNESDCARSFQRAFPSRLKKRERDGRGERGRERKKNEIATKGGREREKGSREGGSDTRVSKDVMRERNGEDEMRGERGGESERKRERAN